jgi:methylmalonyl-CoA epimerase
VSDSGFLKIAHVGIAVRDLDEAVEAWSARLGCEVAQRCEMPERGLRIAFLPVGESMVELLAPLGPDSQIARFLERRGPGIHHICFAVTDIEERLRVYRERGVRLIDETTSIGAEGFPMAFLHPKSTSGVLVEVLEES